jgi:acyl-CoA reductase-like NAD-dependent aldehyde dehydrogenase
VELTGAIVNDAVLGRIEAARGHGTVLLDSREVKHPSYPDAVVRTPLLLTQDAANVSAFDTEWFGPITFVVATDSTAHSVELFRRIVGTKGALTAAVYSTSPEVLVEVEEAALDVGVHLSANLTGGVFVNQSAAFSDFHGTGANAAANAALTDGAYVASRFRIVQSRHHI